MSGWDLPSPEQETSSAVQRQLDRFETMDSSSEHEGFTSSQSNPASTQEHSSGASPVSTTSADESEESEGGDAEGVGEPAAAGVAQEPAAEQGAEEVADSDSSDDEEEEEVHEQGEPAAGAMAQPPQANAGSAGTDADARSARDDAATLLEQLLTEERDENDALVQTARRLVEKTASTYDHVLQLQTKRKREEEDC